MLVKLEETEKDTFDMFTVTDTLNKRPDYDEEDFQEKMNKHWEMQKNFRSDREGNFVVTRYMERNDIEKNYIKFYISVPNGLKKKFLLDYGKFVIDNDIRGSYKIRINKQANDLITIRVYNPKHYKDVFNFIKQYTNQETEQHAYMPTIDGIGVTIDDGGSYNQYLTDNLINFFELCKDINEVTNERFFSYILSPVAKEKLGSNSLSATIYNINLTMALKNNLKIEDIINVIEKSQEGIKNYPVSSTTVDVANRTIKRILKETTSKGISCAMETLDKLMNPPYYWGDIKKAFEYHLLQYKYYSKDEGVLNYFIGQILNYQENLIEIAKLFEKTAYDEGIEGIEKLIETLLNNDITEIVNLKPVYIPYCFRDELHSLPIINVYSIGYISAALAYFNGLDIDEIEGRLLQEKIINIYKNKYPSRVR